MSVHFCRVPGAAAYGLSLEVHADRFVVGGTNGFKAQTFERPDWLGEDEPFEPVVGSPEPFPAKEVRLADLRARPDFADHALYVVPVHKAANRFGEPFNLYAQTLPSKARPAQYSAVAGQIFPLHVFVPTVDCDFTECVFTAYVVGDYGFSCNLPAAEFAPTGRLELGRPRLVLTGPDEIAPGAVETFGVSMRDADGNPLPKSAELFLETTAGYLPRQRVTLEGGAASFRFRALDLEPGDVAKLKVGFKHFTGAAEKLVTVA